MSAHKTVIFTDLLAVLMGALTSLSVGSILLQGIGALILGILGAAGGFIFNRYLKGWLEKLVEKLKKKSDKA